MFWFTSRVSDIHKNVLVLRLDQRYEKNTMTDDVHHAVLADCDWSKILYKKCTFKFCINLLMEKRIVLSYFPSSYIT